MTLRCDHIELLQQSTYCLFVYTLGEKQTVVSDFVIFLAVFFLKGQDIYKLIVIMLFMPS